MWENNLQIILNFESRSQILLWNSFSFQVASHKLFYFLNLFTFLFLRTFQLRKVATKVTGTFYFKTHDTTFIPPHPTSETKRFWKFKLSAAFLLFFIFCCWISVMRWKVFFHRKLPVKNKAATLSWIICYKSHFYFLDVKDDCHGKKTLVMRWLKVFPNKGILYRPWNTTTTTTVKECFCLKRFCLISFMLSADTWQGCKSEEIQAQHLCSTATLI